MKSSFPLKIQYQDGKKETVIVNDPKEIAHRRPFKVLEGNWDKAIEILTQMEHD